MKNIFTIEEKDDAKRLDVFLVENIGQSRASIQSLIKKGGVAINDKAELTPHRFLKEGDSVRIVSIEEANTANHPAQQQQQEQPPETVAHTIPLNIIFENDDVLVVNKSAGTLVQDRKSVV